MLSDFEVYFFFHSVGTPNVSVALVQQPSSNENDASASEQQCLGEESDNPMPACSKLYW